MKKSSNNDNEILKIVKRFTPALLALTAIGLAYTFNTVANQKSAEISDMQNSTEVTEYIAEERQELDDLFSNGEISNSEYIERGYQLQSDDYKKVAADVIYQNDEKYQGLVKSSKIYNIAGGVFTISGFVLSIVSACLSFSDLANSFRHESEDGDNSYYTYYDDDYYDNSNYPFDI